MEVEEEQLPSTQGQQPISSRPTNSVVPPKDRQVKEVEKKMSSQSLTDEKEPDSSNTGDNSDWETPAPLPEVDETPSLRGDPEEDKDWLNMSIPEVCTNCI